jgi:hypothetical protein
MRISTFDELHRSFEREIWRGSQQKMDVVGHDHEFIEPKDPSLTIAEGCIQQQPGGPFGVEQGSASPSYKRDKKYAIGEVFHSG